MICPEPLENPKPKNSANNIARHVPQRKKEIVSRMAAMIANPATMTFFLE
jgi:hypothetical protein